jgi:hypothetical protein
MFSSQRLRTLIKKFLMVSVFCSSIPITPQPAQAQLGEIIGGLVGAYLINKAKEAAHELLADAENRGNALSARLANELSVAAMNTTLLLGDQLNTQVRNMSRQNVILMVNLFQMTQSAKTMIRDVYKLKDTFILDIRALTANVPFSGDPFYIQRIDGVMQLKKKSDYFMDVYGVGLGPASGKVRSSIELKIGDETQQNIYIEQIEANRATMRIPNGTLDSHFDPTAPAFLDISIEVDQEVKRFFGGWKKSHYSIPLRLTLMPLQAGSVTVTAKIPKRDWVPIEPEIQLRTTANLHDQDRHETYELQIKVPGGHTPSIVGDKKLSNLRFGCLSGDVCRWSDVFYQRFFESNTTARAAWQTNSWPTTWQLMVDVAEYREVGQDTITIPFDLVFGRTVEISLPVNAEAIRIRGTTIGGDDIDLIYPQSSDFMTNVPNVSTGQTQTLFYKVNRPAGVD